MAIARNIRKTFVNAAKRFVLLSLILLILIVVMRFFEMLSLWFSTPEYTKFEFYGLINDVQFWTKASFYSFIPFVFIYMLSKILANIMYVLYILVLITIHFVLTHYFMTSNLLLGMDIFGYSIQEIKSIINTSLQTSRTAFIPIIISICIFIIILILARGLRASKLLTFIVFSLIVSVLFIPKKYKSTLSYAEDVYSKNVLENKSEYFLDEVYLYLIERLEKPSRLEPVSMKKNLYATGQNRQYIDTGYPFLQQNKTPHVLGGFFEKADSNRKPPHIVFIVVQGLGSAFSGKQAYLGSFTPYLDQLAEKSITFNHFLSATGKMFGTLPSLLGSLPYGEKGFVEDKIPHHQSLLKILHQNGYQSRFYYGGNARNDKMDVFLKNEGVKQLLDQDNFEANYQKIPQDKTTDSYGYGDKEMFTKYLNDIASVNSSIPRCDILLTRSTQSPFKVNEQDYYYAVFEDRMNQLNFSEELKTKYRKYENQYASILFFDDALNNFIYEYGKRPDFKNTLFIITGNYQMPEIPFYTELDQYLVPFLIYSPLLKRTKTISSVSSHLDVFPTLAAFLNQSYGLKVPQTVHWIGTGIDTVPSFRNIHNYPLKRNQFELVDYISGNYFLSKGELYKLNSNMTITPVDFPQKQEELANELNLFKINNRYVMQYNKLLPDSLKKMYP